ncbi:hypothetical protein [Bradyrhizobium sp. Tv2a-2]|uniref:hypothetical protein n=1 Tax=Bradyrhizobium sp. Tv2a-2 TaxID=113395 RepID=UPI0012EBB8C7|nr:hypothetical protein [Bradyrhizobium sp. Tv2a-2]
MLEHEQANAQNERGCAQRDRDKRAFHADFEIVFHCGVNRVRLALFICRSFKTTGSWFGNKGLDCDPGWEPSAFLNVRAKGRPAERMAMDRVERCFIGSVILGLAALAVAIVLM